VTRPNFVTNVPGICKKKTNFGNLPDSVSSDAWHGEETIIGVSRHKPTGWIPPTSYSLFSRKYQLAMGRTRFDFYLGNSWTQEDGVVGGAGGRFSSIVHFDAIVGEPSIYDATLGNAALIAARLKLKRASVDLGVAFFERKQTARLLGDTATALARSFNHLKRGNVRQAMRDLGLSSKDKEPRGSSVPNKWLELQYGWKPLLSDVFGACEALEQRDKADWRVTARATKKSKGFWSKSWIREESGVGVAVAERSNFTRLDALPDRELLGSLTSLGITNPLLIAWELVPYSFVVDWAFPIGDWLSSLDALLGYSTVSISSTDYTKCSWKEKGVPYTEANWGRTSNSYEGSKEVVKVVRQASNGVPLPTFPSIKDAQSLGHMANGLALLASAFRHFR
jgi:hypothetical protein